MMREEEEYQASEVVDLQLADPAKLHEQGGNSRSWGVGVG